MNRRRFLQLSPLIAAPFVTGCGFFRIDPWHFLVRSPYITSLEQEAEIVSRAKLDWTDDGRIQVLYVQGTPYERGYQHGKLLQKDIQDNIGYIYDKALSKFHFGELFDEAYERMRPYMPREYVEEMHGLAHGSRMPLSIIHAVHVLPSIGEWKGRRDIKNVIKKMMAGELGTSCSNFSAVNEATGDRKLYTVRILDWGLHRISKLHEYPLIMISKPEQGLISANIAWKGFIGCVSGMNEKGITIGEMGYRDPPNETLSGVPMPFMLRDVMTYASNLGDVQKIIKTSKGTNSFAFLMSDGKTGEAEMYVRDSDRFVVFKPGDHVIDDLVDVKKGKKREEYPGIEDISYAGHYEEEMTRVLSVNRGNISPEIIMDVIIPQIKMKSNFQNVVYSPTDLKFWVSNALDKNTVASAAPYTFFDFGKALNKFPS